MKKEIWKDINGYENLYQVSNFGRVKSLLFGKEKILKNSLNCGYYRVNLNGNAIRIHILVAVAFLRHKPDGHRLVVDHIDNNPLNNHLDNLQIITHRKNLSKDKSGYIGVSNVKKSKKFRGRIGVNGKQIYLGMFETEIEASNAYQLKLKEINNLNK